MTTKLYLNDALGIDAVELTGSVPGFEARNLFDGLTHSKWVSAASIETAIIVFTFDTPTIIESFIVSNFNLTDDFISLELYADDVLIATMTDIDSNIGIIEIIDSTEYTNIRIQATKSTPFLDSGFYIGNMSIGKNLELPEGIQPSYTPPYLSIVATIENNITMGGNFIGRSLTLEQYDFIIKQDNISPDWIRANWLDLLRYIQAKPFYYLWDSEHPEDAVYCWTKGDITPPIYNEQCYMSFAFDCNGFIDNAGI